MSSNLVSHDTDKMRNWSNTMNSNSSDYRNLIDELYALIADFANSNIFKGGLATDLSTNIEEQKSEYLRYETLPISPEPTLINGIPIEIKKSKLSASSAVDANIMPIESQCSLIFLKSS